jgi:hypothetical protein
MPYNITNITAIETFYDLGKYAGDVSGGLFWGVILIALFIVMLIRLRSEGPEKAIIATSFSVFTLSIILLYMNFIQIWYPIGFVVILAGTALYKIFKPQ